MDIVAKCLDYEVKDLGGEKEITLKFVHPDDADSIIEQLHEKIRNTSVFSSYYEDIIEDQRGLISELKGTISNRDSEIVSLESVVQSLEELKSASN